MKFNRRYALSPLTALIACLMAFEAVAAAIGDVNFVVGYRELQDDVAEALDIDQHAVIGLQSSFGSSSFPVLFDAGWQISHGEADNTDLEADIYELALGALFAPRHQRSISPYLGLGVSVIYAEVDAGSLSADDTAVGFYARTGVAYRPGNRGFSMGIEYRLQQADFDSDLSNTESDYGQVGLLFGYRWGAGKASSRIVERPPTITPEPVPAAAGKSKPAQQPALLEPSSEPNKANAPADSSTAFPREANRAQVGLAAVLRIRPAADADVLVYVPAKSTVSIRGRKENEYGVWWYATASNGAGWILERDLRWVS